jgi:tetratricopeptide (TPR) repeat protein/DNA-binding CsgD family transcriptional regulator/DNA-binding phage protein
MGLIKSFFTRYKWVVVGVFIALILLILFVLNDNEQDYFRNEIEDAVEVDSVISMLDKLPSGKYESVGYDKVAKYYEGQRDSYEKLLSYLNDRVYRDNTEYAIASMYVGRGLVALSKGEMDSVVHYIQESEKIMPLGNNRCSYFELIAMFHLDRGDLKMSKTYLNKGLEEAIRYRDVVKRRFFLNKLGSICFSESLYGAASKYFLEVYSTYPSGKGAPAELIGNIISVKIVEGNYQEAEVFWNKNEELLAKARDKYAKQLVLINRIELNLHLGRVAETDPLFAQLPDSTVLPSLRIAHLANRLSYAKVKAPDLAMSILRRRMEWVMNDYFGAVTRLEPYLLQSIEENEDLLVSDSLESWKNRTVEQFNDNPMAASNHYRLLSAIYQKVDNKMSEAYQTLLVSNEFKDKYHLLDDSVKRADFTAKKDFESMKTKQFAFEKEMLQQKKINGYLAGTYGSVVLTLLLLVLFLWSRQTAKKKELDWAQMQLHIQVEEKEFLQKEKELNARIIGLSELVMEKSLELSKKLKTLNTNNSPDIETLRKELEALGRVETTSRPQIADSKLKEKGDIMEQYPQLKSMSLTEKRIFILSVDGYKSKDIAAIVGVTPQYIHNVRSKIRKVLGVDNSVHWESFKDKRLQG